MYELNHNQNIVSRYIYRVSNNTVSSVNIPRLMRSKKVRRLPFKFQCEILLLKHPVSVYEISLNESDTYAQEFSRLLELKSSTMLLLIWFGLALATKIICAEHCLFSTDELLKIKNDQVVSIDSKKIVTFVENNPNELAVLNFIENNRKQIEINNDYKFTLERIMNHNGVDHMVCDRRMNQLAVESNEIHHTSSYNPNTKQRLMKMTSRIMLVHGVYGSVVMCSHQLLSINCGLSVGGLTTSAVISHVEPIVVAKYAPKIVEMASRVGTTVGKFIPKAQFAIRLIGTKATDLLKTGGAILGGVFDIVDIGININVLIDCKTNGGCSDRQLRDSIVSISLSGISFVAGIAFAALAMPGIGFVVSLVLFAVRLFYSAFSNVAEYNEKYHIAFDEGANVFFRSLIFMQPSDRVRMLARRTDHIDFSAKMIWDTLENSTETVKGFGMGLGDISLDDNNVRPSFAQIDLTERGRRRLSRVIPHSINSNAEMICLPFFKNEPYENGQSKFVESAVYNCDNAMVFIDKRRSKGNTVVLNLQYVNLGTITGSNEWNNIFLVHDTHM